MDVPSDVGRGGWQRFDENAVAIFKRMLRVYLLAENVPRKCLSMALRKRGQQVGTFPTIK